MHPSVFMLAAALAAGGAQAQQVWRCGNSYQGEPCAGGVPVSVAPAVSAGGAKAAAALARSDAQRAKALEKARLAQEKAAPKAIVIGPQEPAAAPEKKKARAPAPAKPFTAIAPKPPKQ